MTYPPDLSQNITHPTSSASDTTAPQDYLSGSVQELIDRLETLAGVYTDRQQALINEGHDDYSPEVEVLQDQIDRFNDSAHEVQSALDLLESYREELG